MQNLFAHGRFASERLAYWRIRERVPPAPYEAGPVSVLADPDVALLIVLPIELVENAFRLVNEPETFLFMDPSLR